MADLSSRVPSRPRLLPWLVALACGSLLLPGARAQNAPAPPSQQLAAAGLKEVVISGSRGEQDRDELPMSIDVLGGQELERKQIRDIRDVANELPNVSITRAPARFTLAGSNTGIDRNTGFNIRGLDGNRVLMLVDGLRIPRSYAFQPNVAFGRDYFDIGLIQRVEVVRGATSALYGSDGMAGLVNFITADPANFLTDGKTLGGRASAGYSGDDKGYHLGATVAGRASDTVDWLLSLNATRAKALQNMGGNDAANVDRTTPNPETDQGESLLGKVVIRPGGGQKHVLTFEHVDKKADYTLLSAVAKPPLASTSTVAANAHTRMRRDRLTWDGRWRLDAALADELQTVLSYQDADSNEYVFERRNAAASRSRDTTYQERTLQANLQAGKALRAAPGGWAQKITYGLDYTASTITNRQDGLTPPAGVTFPQKLFPDTRESSSAVYLQDEFMNERWSITPGVRFDHFSLNADQAGFSPPSTTPAASLSGSATSPKLGVLLRATPQWSVYGNYAAGFRAPNAGQVNRYFENPNQFYKTLPNPNLKPEKSQNFEIGARGRLDALSFDAALFTGRYKDFIEDYAVVGGAGTAASPLVYQAINRNRVRINGFEFKGQMDWGRFAGGEWSTPFGYGQASGKDLNTGKPINSISPWRLNAGVQYRTAAWDLRLDAAHRAAKNRSDVDFTSTASQFATPSATTLDLSGQWRIRRDLRLNAGVYNLTDRKYWNWADVQGLSSASTVLDAYTQPGRYVRVSLVADF